MSLSVGQQFPARHVSVDRAALVRYAGASGDFNPIHYSDVAAAAAGLPGVIAHGMYTMAVAAEVVTQWCGSCAHLVDLDVRFSRPVVVPSNAATVLEFHGTVLSEDGNGLIRIGMDVTNAGVKILGKAVAFVQK